MFSIFQGPRFFQKFSSFNPFFQPLVFLLIYRPDHLSSKIFRKAEVKLDWTHQDWANQDPWIPWIPVLVLAHRQQVPWHFQQLHWLPVSPTIGIHQVTCPHLQSAQQQQQPMAARDPHHVTVEWVVLGLSVRGLLLVFLKVSVVLKNGIFLNRWNFAPGQKTVFWLATPSTVCVTNHCWVLF